MMMVKVKNTENGCEIHQVMPDGSVSLLRNVRAATLSLDEARESLVTLRVDLTEVEAYAKAEVKCTDREGRLRTIKRIEYTDGGEDLYV